MALDEIAGGLEIVASATAMRPATRHRAERLAIEIIRRIHDRGVSAREEELHEVEEILAEARPLVIDEARRAHKLGAEDRLQHAEIERVVGLGAGQIIVE